MWSDPMRSMMRMTVESLFLLLLVLLVLPLLPQLVLSISQSYRRTNLVGGGGGCLDTDDDDDVSSSTVSTMVDYY